MPPRRSSVGGGKAGLPEYREVQLGRFGWRRQSYESRVDSPLLARCPGVVSTGEDATLRWWAVDLDAERGAAARLAPRQPCVRQQRHYGV